MMKKYIVLSLFCLSISSSLEAMKIKNNTENTVDWSINVYTPSDHNIWKEYNTKITSLKPGITVDLYGSTKDFESMREYFISPQWKEMYKNWAFIANLTATYTEIEKGEKHTHHLHCQNIFSTPITKDTTEEEIQALNKKTIVINKRGCKLLDE